MSYDKMVLFVVQVLNKQVYGSGSKHFLTKVFKDATRDKPFSYIVIDLSQQCPEIFRIRDTIIPIPGKTTVYSQ